MHDDADEVEEALSPILVAAVRELRAEPGVPPGWRTRVVDAARQERARHGAWGSTWRGVLPAILAASVCLIAGTIALRAGAARRSHVTLATAPANEAVRFSLVAPAARQVTLVGDFDVWNPRGVAMHRAADGHTWTVDVALPPGRHAFAYRVDGALRTDPAAAKAVEDDFGMPSSVIVVAKRGLE